MRRKWEIEFIKKMEIIELLDWMLYRLKRQIINLLHSWSWSGLNIIIQSVLLLMVQSMTRRMKKKIRGFFIWKDSSLNKLVIPDRILVLVFKDCFFLRSLSLLSLMFFYSQVVVSTFCFNFYAFNALIFMYEQRSLICI